MSAKKKEIQEAVEEAGTENASIVVLDMGDIYPYENNPRFNESAVEGVARSIQKFGFLVPLVLDSEHVIVTGHTRYLAAQSLGLTEVPCIIASHLTEAEVKAFRLADNRLAQNAKWDETKLSEELEILAAMGFELEDTGFSKEELDCLTSPIEADCLDDLSAAAVCGDVAPVQIVDKKFVSLSFGPYKMGVSLAAFNEWDRAMLEKHGSRADVIRMMLDNIGFTEFEEKFAPQTAEAQ